VFPTNPRELIVLISTQIFIRNESKIRYVLKIYILIISTLMIRSHLQCSLTTFKIVSGL